MTTAAARLGDIDDDITACRAWGHRWPSKNLRPGRKLPLGFRPRAISDGCVEVTETCPDCRKRRITVTLPGGIFNRNVLRQYANPENWPVIKRDEHVTPRDFQAEVFRRVQEELLAEAQRNPVLDDADA